jgi:hypothetical protein
MRIQRSGVVELTNSIDTLFEISNNEWTRALFFNSTPANATGKEVTHGFEKEAE